ncbi:trifunctional histidinol dehydrogenase [Savitreella phatthalungensis]
MKVCPTLSATDEIKWPVCGQVLVNGGADEVIAFVERHFGVVDICADGRGWPAEDVYRALDAGVLRIITEQNVPRDRSLREDSLLLGNPSEETPTDLTVVLPQASLDADALTNLLLRGVTSDRPDGLFATVVCDTRGSCLGLAYSSAQSVSESLSTGKAVYQSRKRGLWYKGATSGDVQLLHGIDFDCDSDTIRFVVLQEGRGFCHLPQYTCFGDARGLTRLERTLQERQRSAPEGSYTARLFSDDKLLRAKILEEADELCDAIEPKHAAFEAADLVYFALARCVKLGVSLSDVERSLDRKSLKIQRRKGDAKEQYQAAVKAKEEAVVAQVKSMGDDPPIDDREGLKLRVFRQADLDAAQTSALLRRPIKTNDEITKLVRPIIEAVRSRGDEAVLEFTEKFDGAKLASPVMRAPFPQSAMELPADTIAAIDQAFSNIQRFHEAQLANERPIAVETMPGVTCSRYSRAIESVGLYIPGGTAVLPSTAMMLGIPSMVAGCKHIIFASPPRRDGSLNPEIVYIAHKVGAESIVLAGGAQAIAALAYGTEAVHKVDKILGPGNQFVTAAKSLVSGDPEALVSIDMPAGPSEVLILADGQSDPRFVASDLLSQAEHGADSQSVLVGIDLTDAQIKAIQDETIAQANRLPRVDILRKSIAHSYILNASNLADAIDVTNRYAPEHLIVYTANSVEDAKRITNAGSIFVGAYAPVACGDYASGTNHTLPTYGYAKQYSGVNTSSFLKAITSQYITRDGLQDLGKVVMRLAEVEGLDAHKNSVSIRLE